MPRLADLLAYLAQPENEDIWVLLDIKKDDDARELLAHVTSTISSIPPAGRPWKDRIILGPWDVSLTPYSPPLSKIDLNSLTPFPRPITSASAPLSCPSTRKHTSRGPSPPQANSCTPPPCPTSTSTSFSSPSSAPAAPVSSVPRNKQDEMYLCGR